MGIIITDELTTCQVTTLAKSITALESKIITHYYKGVNDMSLDAWGDEPPDAYLPEIESDEDAIAADAEEFTSTDRYSLTLCACGGRLRSIGVGTTKCDWCGEICEE